MSRDFFLQYCITFANIKIAVYSTLNRWLQIENLENLECVALAHLVVSLGFTLQRCPTQMLYVI